MAEVVEYRVEKTLDELNLLVDFGLFTAEHAKEIVAKRQDYEYVLRRRNKTKLDFVKYIKFEVNLLESIEKYRKTVIENYHKSSKKTAAADKSIDEIERKIILLQAKKLNDVVRSRSSHISSLFRKLTTSFQFDKKLWLAYIEFAKSRNWNTRATSLYWRLLRVSGSDPDIWLAAAAHEVDVNKTYDIARGLYLRALRHHPRSSKIWAEYFKMELRFMEIVDQRARIVFKTTNSLNERNGQSEKTVASGDKDKEAEEEDIWAEKDNSELKEQVDDDPQSGEEEERPKNDNDALPEVKPIDDNDTIISGHLPKVIYNNAADALVSTHEFQTFIILILTHILSSASESKGMLALREFICEDIRKRSTENDSRISKDLADNCNNLAYLKERAAKLDIESENSKSSKRLRRDQQSKMDILYERYEAEGLEATRQLFDELEKSVKNQTLSLYVGMIQVESWQLPKDKSESQLNRIRSLYDRALMKFGNSKAKLWYEYLQFEHDHAKSLQDFDHMHQLYTRAQATLDPAKVDKVIMKYTLMQANSTSADIEYSDYSDLED